MEMLRRWSERYDREATYLKIAEGFDKLKKRDLIEELIMVKGHDVLLKLTYRACFIRGNVVTCVYLKS